MYDQKSRTSDNRKKMEEILKKFESYELLCKRLSCAKPKDIEKSVSEKNEELTNKFLFLLRTYAELLPKKLESLSISKVEVPENDKVTVEVLSGMSLLDAVSFGITTPCCLSLPASGTKYLYAILFDSRVSVGVVRDKDGRALATCLVTDNGDQLGMWHVDISKFFEVKDSNLLFEDKKKKKIEIIKKAMEYLGVELANKNGKTIFIAPGEATLVNLGFLNKENIVTLNKFLQDDLLRMENVSLEELQEIKKSVDQANVQKIVKCERIGVAFDAAVVQEAQASIERKIESSVGGGRTDVGSFKYLAYALENFEELSTIGQNRLKEFISEATGWKIVENHTEAVNGNDLFELNKDDGHGLCKIQFVYANPIVVEQESTVHYDSRFHVKKLAERFAGSEIRLSE